MAKRKLPRASAKKKPVAHKASKPTAKRAKSAPKSAKSTRATANSAPAKGKWVYSFGDGRAEGKANMRELLGGKGAGLAEMANPGRPVPPGFTITTTVRP